MINTIQQFVYLDVWGWFRKVLGINPVRKIEGIGAGEHLPNCRRLIRIGLVNTYLQGREKDIACGEYPAHHLWGVDHLPADTFSVIIIPPSGTGLVNKMGRWFSKLSRYRFGDFDQEWEIWKRRKMLDVVYVANGGLFFLLVLRRLGLLRPKVVRWVYVPRQQFPWWTFRNVAWQTLLRGTDVLLCLTLRAAQAHEEYGICKRVQQMDWGVDIDQFRPGPRDGGFFLSCGKTNRDYSAILEAAEDIPAQIILVVHGSVVEGRKLSPNIVVESGSPDGVTDRGLPYSELISRLYHRAIAMLIPLKGIKDDTAGMTNLLEAMACGLPVIMTRASALDLDLEKEGAGVFVTNNDPESWRECCEKLLLDPSVAAKMGTTARELAVRHYNTGRLGGELAHLFTELCPLA